MRRLTQKVVTLVVVCTTVSITALVAHHFYTEFRNNYLYLPGVVSYEVNRYGITFQTDKDEEYYLEPMELTTSDQGNTILIAPEWKGGK